MSKGNSGAFSSTQGDKIFSGNLNNQLPTKDSQLKHIFRNAEGHLLNTPENRKLITEAANNPNNFVGIDKYGNQWYSAIQSDGSQIWVISRNGTIQNAGKNNPPKTWDNETGYSRNPKNTEWRKKK